MKFDLFLRSSNYFSAKHMKKRVKVVELRPTPDHLFVKRWNKNFFLKSMICFCNKVSGGVWGNAPFSYSLPPSVYLSLKLLSI